MCWKWRFRGSGYCGPGWWRNRRVGYGATGPAHCAVPGAEPTATWWLLRLECSPNLMQSHCLKRHRTIVSIQAAFLEFLAAAARTRIIAADILERGACRDARR